MNWTRVMGILMLFIAIAVVIAIVIVSIYGIYVGLHEPKKEFLIPICILAALADIGLGFLLFELPIKLIEGRPISM